MNVKIMVMVDGLKTSLGTFNKGTLLSDVTDSPKLQKLALAGDIEYCNPAQTGLFD
tara:strand:- start:21023 stop:21190 length:168 start_codon:yes stop_codon:yes gene_type:complete